MRSSGKAATLLLCTESPCCPYCDCILGYAHCKKPQRLHVVVQDDATATAVGAESHSQLRALALALYLLFPSEEGKLGVEAIGSKQLHRGIKLLKQKPVVPGFGDMPLSLLFILHELSPFLVAQGKSSVPVQLFCIL